MIDLTLPKRDQQTLFTGVCVMLSLIFLTRGLPTWWHWQSNILADAAVTRNEATASQSAVHDTAELTRILRQLEQGYFSLSPVFVPGDHSASQGAALISVVNTAAQLAGIQIGALQVEMDTSMEPEQPLSVRPMTVRGDGAGDITGITRFLANLEGSIPILSIRELSIATADVRTSDTQPETLHIDFIVDGLRRPEEQINDNE